jgi:predicted ATPase
MVGKLNRLPAETQTALQLLACLGNTAKIVVLSIVLEVSAEQAHAALWEAIRQELIEPLEGSYRFMHDRVQEAAYSLIPEERRPGAHLHRPAAGGEHTAAAAGGSGLRYRQSAQPRGHVDHRTG